MTELEKSTIDTTQSEEQRQKELKDNREHSLGGLWGSIMQYM